MKKHPTLVLVVLLVLIPSMAAVAQNYPFPASTPGAQVICTTCEDPYKNLPTWPYQLPVKTFTGRFVDSHSVRNFQAGSGLRTLRARGTIVAPELDRVYVILGQGLAAYKLSTFFTSKLGSPLATVSGVSREGGYYEQFLPYDWYAYAEGRNSGWVTKIADGQDRLFAADYDDRGNVYLAYQLFGWGIVRDSDGKLITQIADAEGIAPLKILTLKSGSRYYALVNGGSNIGLWETTNPASPTFVRKWRGSVSDWEKTTPSGLVAILSPSSIDVYTVNGMTTGASAVANIPAPTGMSFGGLTSDGTDFYAVAGASGKPAVLTRISASTLNATHLNTDLAIRPQGLTHGAGIFTIWGTDGVTNELDVRLTRLENGIPREINLNNYFMKYFTAPPAGYARPSGYSSIIPDSRVVRYGGRDYLVHSQYAFGDVYELQTRDSINIDQVRAYHGSDNPYSKGAGLYYGDPLRFRSGTSGQVAERLQWNFDNPEAPAAPVFTSTTGVDIDYQYVGVKTDSDITRQRTVRAEVTTDATNFAIAKITMQAPVARVGVKNSTLLFLQPNASATAPIVLGNQFVDSSDGSIEGHYSVWTLDSATTMSRPDTPLNVGGCGAHSLAYEGHYVPYVDGAPITPRYADTYALIRSISSLDYTVRPFAASILIGTPTAGIIPFINRTAVGDPSAFAGGINTPVTVTWQLLDNVGNVLQADAARMLTLGTLKDDVFQLSQSLVPTAGGTVTLKVDILDSAIADANCRSYTSSSAVIAVKAPDPTLTISNCTNVGSPCRLVAGSASGADMSGWAFKWKVDGVQKSTSQIWEMTSATSKTYFPTAKTYTIDLEATNAVTMRSVSQSLTLQPSLCSGAPKGVVIGWSGATTGCATGQCTTNEPINFKPAAWGYTFQDCDTFDWSFGDGTANSAEQEPLHTFPGNGPYTVTLVVKNSDGQTSANTTVQFGTVPPPPPPPPPGCPTKAPEPVYIDWKGPASGCSAISGKDCITTENVQLTAEFLGYTVQTCDSITWVFDNGKTGNGKVVSTNFPTAKTYNVKVTITNTKGSKTRTTAIAVSAGTPPPTCPDTAPGGQLGLEWVGQTSGCKTGTGTANCLPGETINFQLWLVGYSQQACDTFEWNFGDGQTTTTNSPLTTHTYGPSVSGSVNVSVTVKNSKGTKNVSKAVFFGTTGSCEVPAVNISGPSRAGVGKAVTFQGSVTPVDVEVLSWAWSFGPGQTAQGQGATHTFNTPGTYDVTLTVRTGCAKEVQKVLRVTVADNSFAYLLPAVAHLELSTGTWKTDLQFYVDDANLATQPLELTVEWTSPAGVVSKQLLLQSSTLIYEDFMKFFDAQAQMASGAIVIRGASDVVPQIWTRTYIVPPSGIGSYGQLIPAIPLDEDPGAVTDPPSLILAGLQSAKGSLYRTNIGIINPTNKPQTVSVALYDTQGFTIVAFDEVVNPYTLNQVNVRSKLGENWVDSDHYSAKLWTASGDQIFAYASTIDNTSNDPVYQAAISDGDVSDEVWRKQVVVGVGHLGTWRSDVTVFNADGGPIQVNLTYLDQAGAKIAEALNVVIPARSFQHIEGLMRWSQFVPPQTGDTYGTLFVETKGAVTKFPMVFARTYSDQGELGTYGQGIAAFSAARPNVTLQKAAVIPGVREERDDPANKGYYTNIGLLNLTDQPTEVRIALLDEITGAEIGATGATLGANESKILPRIISGAPLHPSAARGTIKVQVVSGGPIWAFASIIDNKTKDAEYVPAVPLP